MPEPHEGFEEVRFATEHQEAMGALAVTNYEETEDPLAGDVDRVVHPDETRTEEQIAFDRQYAVEPYGHDAADDYWAEYDEHMGTVNGGEEPEPLTKITDHPGYVRDDGKSIQVFVKTPKRQHQVHTQTVSQLREEGLTDDQIGEKLDVEYDERWTRINKEQDKLFAQMDEDDYDGTDPLEGDVDR